MRLNSSALRIASLLLTLLFPILVAAQGTVSEKEKQEQEVEKREQLKRKTLGLVDEIISGAWGLKLPENRAFLQVAAADLLWAHDEKRARNLFWDALNSLGVTAIIDETATKDAPKEARRKETSPKSQNNDTARRQREYYEIYTVRREFLRTVARRDPQLALDMLQATRQGPPPETNAAFRPPDESDLEQEIANETVERDPKRALQIARESLAKGVSFELINLLTRLNQKSQEAGTEFAGDIIEKLQTTSLTSDLRAWWIATSMLLSSSAPAPRLADAPATAFKWLPLKLSDDQRSNLVQLLTDAALSPSVNPNAVNGLSEVMPEIEHYAPDRAAKLKIKMAQATSRLTQEQKEWSTYNTLYRTGTSEEMIKAAATAGDEQRYALYREAVIKAAADGRADALREFINSQIEDESRRKALLDSLDTEQIGFAANRGKTEELQKALPQIRLKEQRAWAMAELAILLEKKGEHEKALELLSEAQTLVKVDLMSETHSRALLTLLLANALVDPPRAFAMVEPIIDRANDNISKLLLLDKIAKSSAVKNGEIILSQPNIPLDFAILKYGPGVVAIAKADFNRTKGLADRFQRNELRLLARLVLAQSLLRSLEQAAGKPRTSAASAP
ncbi:MAG: hypothetical protein WAM70_05715 [Pyrinomonadaceae bacterium]